MPQLFRFLLWHIFTGTLAGWLLVAGLLYADIGGFGSLVLDSPQKWVALAMLAIFFSITFGSASVATAVLLGHDFDDGCNGSNGPDQQLAVIPVKRK